MLVSKAFSLKVAQVQIFWNLRNPFRNFSGKRFKSNLLNSRKLFGNLFPRLLEPIHNPDFGLRTVRCAKKCCRPAL